MFQETIHKKISPHPHIVITGALHGDEVIGVKVVEHFEDILLKKGTLSGIIGHPEALKQNMRYIETDLNRSFPGNIYGSIEEKIAHHLYKYVQYADYTIDIHATNSNFLSAAIITKDTPEIRYLLSLLPIENVLFVKDAIFGGNELITHTNIGISLEYGPDKSGTNSHIAIQDITKLLINLDMIEGRKEIFSHKHVYTITGTYETPANFIPSDKLKDFHKIHKGEEIGVIDNSLVYSDQTFYPVFLGKGRYPGTLCLISQHKKINDIKKDSI